MKPASEEFARQLIRVGTKTFKRVFKINGVEYLLACKLNRLKERCKSCGKPRWENEE